MLSTHVQHASRATKLPPRPHLLASFWPAPPPRASSAIVGITCHSRLPFNGRQPQRRRRRRRQLLNYILASCDADCAARSAANVNVGVKLHWQVKIALEMGFTAHSLAKKLRDFQFPLPLCRFLSLLLSYSSPLSPSPSFQLFYLFYLQYSLPFLNHRRVCLFVLFVSKQME